MRRAIAADVVLTGRALARGKTAPRAGRRWLVLLAAGVAVSLAIAGLRMDLIRVKYGLADAVRTEKALAERRNAARAAVRELRDPKRLAALAHERGFVRPAAIHDLASGEPRP